MKYYVVESVMTNPLPVSESDMEKIYIPKHIEHLKEAIDSGMLLVGGPNEYGGGFLLLRAMSLQSVTTFLNADPFQIYGLNHFRVTEFFPKDRSPMIENW